MIYSKQVHNQITETLHRNCNSTKSEYFAFHSVLLFSELIENGQHSLALLLTLLHESSYHVVHLLTLHLLLQLHLLQHTILLFYNFLLLRSPFSLSSCFIFMSVSSFSLINSSVSDPLRLAFFWIWPVAVTPVASLRFLLSPRFSIVWRRISSAFALSCNSLFLTDSARSNSTCLFFLGYLF